MLRLLHLMDGIIQWLAPILSTVIVTFATASINSKIAEGEKKRDSARAETEAKRKQEAEWREGVTQRLDDMEDKLNRSVLQQTVQIRSDIIHKCHRYLDDLGRASSEEKETLSDAYEQYCKFCADLDIENDFINMMVARVMELPERERPARPRAAQPAERHPRRADADARGDGVPRDAHAAGGQHHDGGDGRHHGHRGR